MDGVSGRRDSHGRAWEATHNGVQASEGGTDGQTGEARLGDGRVDDPLLAEAVEETLGDLVTAAPSAPSALAAASIAGVGGRGSVR